MNAISLKRVGCVVAAAWLAALGLPAAGAADDWPTYRHDNRRSGATPEKLQLPLAKAWQYTSPTPPRPAWGGPAKWDAFAGVKGLKSMRDFDSVFHVTVAGGVVAFGSSVDDAAHCLDAATGAEKWAFCTDGPVRLPPTWRGGKAYFGSDDGCAYCVDGNGKLLWKYRAAPEERYIPSNGKLISVWPCRTGVLVADGKAYFAASLLPWRDSYLCAVDAATGSDRGAGLYRTAQSKVTMQGAMLASGEGLCVPQGRSAPLRFKRADGEFLGALPGGGNGGTYAFLTPQSHLVYGPGNKAGWLSARSGGKGGQVLSFPGARRMVVVGAVAYVQQQETLAAFDYVRHFELSGRIDVMTRRRAGLAKQLKALAAKRRAADAAAVKGQIDALSAQIDELGKSVEACYLWRVPCPAVHELIAAGDVLLAGEDDRVRALAVRDGKQVWAAAVLGKAAGLAVAGGRLFVSTDFGRIYCFAPGRRGGGR